MVNFVTSNPQPLTESDYKDAAVLLGCELAAILAVASVESRGEAFLPSGRPPILFESRVFHSRTGGVFDIDHPELSTPTWIRNYKGGELEYDRLEAAMKLDEYAALASCSWGMFQIMGFNFAAAGFGDVHAFVRGMVFSACNQLLAFVSFIKANKLQDHLKHHRWAQFARQYNGPGYAQNKYDEKLMAAYERYAAQTKKSVVT